LQQQVLAQQQLRRRQNLM